MFGRLLRVTSSVLVIAVAFVTPVLLTSAPASAALVPFSSCTIVANPTASNFTNCPNTDFSNQDLLGVDLNYANLSGSSFNGALLAQCVQAPSSSPPWSCSNATTFEQATLSQATFTGATMTSCVLVPANPLFENAVCTAANLSGANLESADLSGTNLSDVSAPGADLVGANLTGATFTASLSNGSEQIPSTFATDFTGADLAGLNLDGTDLTDPSLAGANLTGTQLQNANLAGAGLSNANLTDANLSGATLTGAVFTGTILVPSGQSVPATSQSGAVVTWPTPAGLPGATPGTCSPASGSTFAVGATTVTCQVLDGAGDVATGSFQVTVNPLQGPTTSVLLPSNGATITATTWLDAGASSPIGVASVNFELSGGEFGVTPTVISGSTPTLYGWIGAWNSSTIAPNGTYTLQSVATDKDGVSSTSAPITITVDNPLPTAAVIIPSAGATQSGTSALLDAVATNADSVSFELTEGATTQVVGATPTIYGWLAEWNTTTLPNGTVTIHADSSTPEGGVASAPITITVSN